MKASTRNQAALITGPQGSTVNGVPVGAGAVLDLDMNVVASAGTVSGALYPTQAGWEDPFRYRPAEVRPDGAVVDLNGRVLAGPGTVTFS